jgi:hypothetical protein
MLEHLIEAKDVTQAAVARATGIAGSTINEGEPDFHELWEDPPGVFRVGKSRVFLELVLGTFQRGESPEGIVRSYRTLSSKRCHLISIG